MNNSSVSTPAIPVVRGCGTRKPDGVYLECGMSPFGSPVESFLFDPPLAIPHDLSVSPLGVTFVQSDGVVYVVDWVGAEHYPNVADFIEEVRRFGLSRRISSASDFSLLTDKSRILLVHAKAGNDNWRAYIPYGKDCPKNKGHEHDEQCAALWWDDVSGGDKAGDDERAVERHMPSFTYAARCLPSGVMPDYRPMFFAGFPISRIAIVRGDRVDELLEKVQATSLPVAVVEK